MSATPPAKRLLRCEVDGRPVEVAVRPHDVLLDVLRNDLGKVGTKRGCDQGSCGCCTVHIDGKPTLSCLTLALWADGTKVTTVEGVAGKGEAHPLQAAFESCGATQCGYCTPGFIMAAKGLLDRHAHPDEATIKEHLSGNLCRCTGYLQIVEAVRLASEQLSSKDTPHDDRREEPAHVQPGRQAGPAGR
ncbi:MAG TPA: (2Fe-2S)-binding protein [Planctomycetota bacterium]|nr:(2Fe-2S)-binding protein [Planctomycetota bacterium]